MGEISTFYASPHDRSMVLPGVPADHTYQVSVRAYRTVDSDIDASGRIVSSTVATGPYQPTSSPEFRGDILGTIQGRDSLLVVTNLENIASDAILSTTEKPGLILSYNQAITQYDALLARAVALGDFVNERDAATAAKNALVTYLTSLSPAWNDTSVHTPIVPATFHDRWASFYAAIADLNAAITGQPGQDGNPGEPGAPGSPGAPARIMTLTANKLVQPLDLNGNLLDTGDFIVTANRQNLAGPTVWAWEYGHGQEPAFTTVSGDSFTVTAARVRELINHNRAVFNNPTAKLTASYVHDGVTYSDSVSFVQVQNGQTGAQGPQGSQGPGGPQGRNAIVFNQDDNPSGMLTNDTWYQPATKKWFRFDGTNWVQLLGAVSNLDIISANNISVANLAAISANLGTFTTINANGSTTISGSVIEVRDHEGVLRVRMGLW